jgi:hypothetical protein
MQKYIIETIGYEGEAEWREVANPETLNEAITKIAALQQVWSIKQIRLTINQKGN